MGHVPSCQWDTSPLTINYAAWDKSHMTRPPTVSTDAAPVAHEVHRRMVERGIGQKALAEGAGLNETYVRDLFKAKSKNPKTDQLQKLADFFGCSLEALTGPGGSGGDQHQYEVVDPSGILPLRPSEFPLIAMWRILDQSSRDALLAKVAEIVAARSKRRKGHDI